MEIIANGAHDDLARVEPHAHLQGDAVGPLDFGGILVHGGLHGQGRIAGPHRMVLMGQGGTEQGHDTIAHDLIDRALIAMHGRHHALQDGVEELPGLLRVAIGQQFHRALEVGKQHRDLLALAFQGTAGRENLLRKIGGRVGQRGTLLSGGGWGGGRGRGASVPDPDQDAARLIGRKVLGLKEFLFEGFECLIIEMEVEFERPICHALPLLKEGNHLIEGRVKVHRAPSCGP